LVGAGLALFAAYLSVRWIRKQIEQDKLHHADEISRRHNATRLTLPLALASIHEMIQKAANEIAARLENHFERDRQETDSNWIDDVFAAMKFERIELDSSILASFKDFVETLRNTSDIKHIAELVSSLQIFISRYNSYDPIRSAGAHSLNSLMLDAAKIKRLTDAIYNYARFVDDRSFGIVSDGRFAESWDEIHGAAQSLIFLRSQPDDFFPAFQEIVDRYKAGEISPWNEKFK
jgi:hypothetical protein